MDKRFSTLDIVPIIDRFKLFKSKSIFTELLAVLMRRVIFIKSYEYRIIYCILNSSKHFLENSIQLFTVPNLAFIIQKQLE